MRQYGACVAIYAHRVQKELGKANGEAGHSDMLYNRVAAFASHLSAQDRDTCCLIYDEINKNLDALEVMPGSTAVVGSNAARAAPSVASRASCFSRSRAHLSSSFSAFRASLSRSLASSCSLASRASSSRWRRLASALASFARVIAARSAFFACCTVAFRAFSATRSATA